MHSLSEKLAIHAHVTGAQRCLEPANISSCFNMNSHERLSADNYTESKEILRSE